MNWRYIVGKSLSNVGNSVLCSRLMPLTRIVPQGISYPYDIKRFYKPYNVKTIFDVGANIGQTSLFLSNHFPQADIFAFEPIKDTYELFKNNSKNLPKIQPFNYAFGSQETQKLIQLRENSELNTLVNSKNTAVIEEKKVETVTIKTLDNFCKSKNIDKIDILKMDVQGYELEVLYGADYYLKNNLISFIYTEIDFNPDNQECQYFEDINKLFQQNNFRLSGFYEFFRWGENKRYFGFCNALFVNCNL